MIYRVVIGSKEVWKECILPLPLEGVKYYQKEEAEGFNEIQNLFHYWCQCEELSSECIDRHYWTSRDRFYMDVYDENDEVVFSMDDGYSLPQEKVVDPDFKPGYYLFHRRDVRFNQEFEGTIEVDEDDFDPSKFSVKNIYRVKGDEEDDCWFDEEFLPGMEDPIYMYGLCYDGKLCDMYKEDDDDSTPKLTCIIGTYVQGMPWEIAYEGSGDIEIDDVYDCMDNEFDISDYYDHLERYSVKEFRQWIEKDENVPDCYKVTTIEIPNTETEIAEGAYRDYQKLKKVIIPNSVTEIGPMAFTGCVDLEEIVIPDSVKSIGDMAFYGCSSLKEINLPNSIEFVGEHVFVGTSIERIVMPESLTEIGDYNFTGCNLLKEIWFKNADCEFDASWFDGVNVYVGPNCPASFGEEKMQKNVENLRGIPSTKVEMDWNSWLSRSSESQMKLVDELLLSINKFTAGGDYELNYTSSYIGLKRGGKSLNWTYFIPQRKQLVMYIIVPVDKAMTKLLNQYFEWDVKVMKNNNGYQLVLKNDEKIDKLEFVLRMAENERLDK